MADETVESIIARAEKRAELEFRMEQDGGDVFPDLPDSETLLAILVRRGHLYRTTSRTVQWAMGYVEHNDTYLHVYVEEMS